MNVFTTFEFLISGTIFGIILFQTALSAPIVFKFLEADQAKIYIRKIFPKIFSLNALLGLVFLSLHFLSKNQSIIPAIIGMITILFSLLCYLLIPSTNLARDKGNTKKFKLLHRVSVILTMIVFLSNVIWPFL
jgi:hypothetical protein